MKKQRKHINLSCITAFILSVAMLAGFCPQGVSFADIPITLPKVNAAENISNPRIVKDSSMDAGQKVTWDCVYFGSYPQSEVTSKDGSIYNSLKNATGWDENNDITIGGTKYRRLKGEDATYAASDEKGQYDWNNSYKTYHYFKYEPIKWRVLNRNGNDALLLADVALDDQKYNTNYEDVTWETSSMRSWLNGYGASVNQPKTDYSKKNFINSAFTSTQRSAIKTTSVVNNNNIDYETAGGNNTSDKVFLLSESEVYNTDTAAGYGFVKDDDTNDEARRSRCSTYAYAMGTWRYYDTDTEHTKSKYNGNIWWWVGSPGYDSDDVAYVDYDGGWVDWLGNHVDSSDGGVRPALHLNLASANLYSYTGTVCSDAMKSGESGTDNPVNPGEPDKPDTPSGEITTTPTKVTEDMLFTPEYCKYLNNTTYNKMFDTLWKDMVDVSNNCKWADKDIVLKTVMSDGVAGQLKRSGEYIYSLCKKKDISAEKVQSALALDYVNHAKEYSDYCADLYDKTTDSLSKSKKVISLLKKGSGKAGSALEWVANDEDVKEFAQAINSIFSYGDDLKVENDLKKILKSSEVMKSASNAFKISGKAISAYQIAVSVEMLRITTEQTQQHYMSLVDKKSTVYQGLKLNYQKMKRQDAANFALEMLDRDGITDVINALSDKLLGGGTAGATVTVANFIYTGIDFVMKKIGVIDIQDYLKVQYAMLDQSWLKLAVSNQRLNIFNSVYDAKTLKNNYQDAFELYLSCMLQIPDYMENYSGTDKYYKKLKEDVKKYKSKLTYRKYLESCLKNANAVYSYTLSGDKATITKINPSTSKTASVRSPFALNVMAMGNEDNYCIDIPDEIDGYEVEAIDTDVFADKAEPFAVNIPESVKTVGEGAFQDCTSLTQIFLNDGLETIESDAFSGCTSLNSVNIPDTVTEIQDNAIGENTQIESSSDSPAVSYASENGNTFTQRDKSVSKIAIKKNMDKTPYLMSESLDLTGLELTVTYVDGTSENITEGYTGDFAEKQTGSSKVNIYYNGAITSTTVQVNSSPCTYTIIYQNECGEEIYKQASGNGLAGQEITLPLPEIDGYAPTEKTIKKTLGENNIFIVTYVPAKKKSIKTASVSYKKNYIRTGKEIKPVVEVRYGGSLLKENVDYTVEYNNTINAGEGHIWISGIGDYEDITVYNFTIADENKNSSVNQNNKANGKVVVSSIRLSGISKQIAAGKKLTLKAIVFPNNASDKKLIWKSSNPKVATVTQSGVVTLKKKTGGKKVTITATAMDGSKKYAFWKIASMKGIVKKVKITGSKTVKPGKKLKLKAKVTATKKANKKILWTSSNTKYATVNVKGIVTTKKSAKGKTVKITAMATDGSGKKNTVKIKIK